MKISTCWRLVWRFLKHFCFLRCTYLIIKATTSISDEGLGKYISSMLAWSTYQVPELYSESLTKTKMYLWFRWPLQVYKLWFSVTKKDVTRSRGMYEMLKPLCHCHCYDSWLSQIHLRTWDVKHMASVKEVPPYQERVWAIVDYTVQLIK